MTLPVPQTPASVGIDVKFLQRQAPELARDIVMRLDGARALAHHYGLSDAQWDVLRQWPAFVELIQRATEELTGPLGEVERARRKARLAVAEFGITDMATLMGDPKVSPQHRVAAFSELKEIAGLSGKTNAAGAVAAGMGGPLIQINFPDGRQFGIAVNNAAIEGETA